MKLNKLIAILAIIALVVSIVSLIFNPSSSSTKTPVSSGNNAHQLLQNYSDNIDSIEQYQIDIEITGDNSKSFLAEIDSKNLRSTHKLEAGDVEYIYIDNQTYYKPADSQEWLLLTIGKIDPVVELSKYDINTWDREQIQLLNATDQADPDCSPHTCQAFSYVTEEDTNLTVYIDIQDNLVRQATMVETSRTINFNYLYDKTLITAPPDYKEYSIPDDPSDLDIQTLQEIYGE